MSQAKPRSRAFTLIELMIVVAIVGVLAVLAVYGVRKYVLNSKTTEAKNVVGEISRDAVAALEKENTGLTIIKKGQSTAVLRQLCASSTQVPATIPAARKYQSTAADWTSGNATTGWKCLKFAMQQPQYYSYQYQALNTTSTAGVFQVHAWGDLNGDGATSHFWINGSVVGGQLTVSPTVNDTLPEE